MIHFKPFKFGRAEWGILVAFTGLGFLALGVATVPLVATGYGQVTEVWTKLALQYGYWGAFFSALIGSVTVIIVFPYTLVVFFLATQGLSAFWLGILMGLGAAIGQMSGYLIGMAGTRFLKKEKPETFDALKQIVRVRPWLVQWLLFFFAVTPLPDDLLFIPLGMLRYPWWLVFIPTLFGKIISGWIVTYSSHFLFKVLDTRTATPATAIVSQFVTFFALAILLYVMLRLDWQKMMHRLIDNRQPPEMTPTHLLPQTSEPSKDSKTISH